MKILTFTSLFPNSTRPELGVFIYQRAQHIARLPGTVVQVIAPVPYSPTWLAAKRWRIYGRVRQKEMMGNLETWHPRYALLPGISMPLHGFLMFLGALGAGRRLHRQFAFDCIDAHYVYPDGFAAILLGKILNIPVVVSARGTDINVFPSFGLIRPLIRWTLQQAKGLIAVSSALKDRMVRLGTPADKIRVIPNGIDVERFGPMDRYEARRSLGIPVTGALIVSVGSLVPAKRHAVLIEAVAQLSTQIPGLKAYIIGDGSLRSELEDLRRRTHMEDRVFLVGEKSNAELCRWFSAADASCLVSAREGWPNVVMESLACGTPVIATRVGGIPEIIVSSELGILVAEDLRSITDGIASALSRKWDREALVSYARSRTWEVVATEVEEYLSALTKMSSD
jgi:glycosyltransferase involved in cell wall biosynthesis